MVRRFVLAQSYGRWLVLLGFALSAGCSSGGGERPIDSPLMLDFSETLHHGSPPQLWLSGYAVDANDSPCAHLDYDFAQLPDELRIEARGVVDARYCVLQKRGGAAGFRQILDGGTLEVTVHLEVWANAIADHYDVSFPEEVVVTPIGPPGVSRFAEPRWWRVPGGLLWWFARPNLNNVTTIDPAVLAQLDALLVANGCGPKVLHPGHYKALDFRVDDAGQARWQATPTSPPDLVHTYYYGAVDRSALAQAVNAFIQAHEMEVWFYLGDDGGPVATF